MVDQYEADSQIPLKLMGWKWQRQLKLILSFRRVKKGYLRLKISGLLH